MKICISVSDLDCEIKPTSRLWANLENRTKIKLKRSMLLVKNEHRDGKLHTINS